MTSRFNPTRQLQRRLTTLATVFTLTISTFGMNKAELVDAIANEANLSKADAKRALEAFIDTTSSALKKGDRVALVGFGSFSVSRRAARTGRNPQTGKEIQIAAKNVVKFKAGAELSGNVRIADPDGEEGEGPIRFAGEVSAELT